MPGPDATGGLSSEGGGATGGGATGGAATGGSPQLSEDFQIEVQLASEIMPQAPTTVGVVDWSLPGHTITSARLEFGPDEQYGMQAPVDLEAEAQRTLLLGMKPMSTYHFRVVAHTQSGALFSKDWTIQTGAPPNFIDVPTFDVRVEASRERGFIVTSFWRGDGASVIFILDADGDIVWWHDTKMEGVARARMSADGRNMWMISPNNQGSPLKRVSMDTLEEQTYADTIGSHDLTPIVGSTMAYLDYGESDCDSIFEIEPDGSTTEIWDSEDVASGMCHGNALRYSRTEDVFTFSDVSTDVWVISRSGEFEWGLAERVSGGVASWGGSNHGHHLLGDSFVIFANRGAGNMSSTVVEYDLQGNELMNYDGGEFSANLGDVQRLPGGNTLVTYSNSGVIHEITPEKELVLVIQTSGSSFGYALWRDSLYGEPPDLGL